MIKKTVSDKKNNEKVLEKSIKQLEQIDLYEVYKKEKNVGSSKSTNTIASPPTTQ
jgi:hypothetical protein